MKGAEVLHAQTFPERWCAKGSVKGRSKTVPDLSRLMYYSAKSTLKKCRQTEKETGKRLKARQLENPRNFANNGQEPTNILLLKEEQRRTEQKMKKDIVLTFPAFRNGEDSLKITRVSAWKGAKVLHAQEFSEQWTVKRVRTKRSRTAPDPTRKENCAQGKLRARPIAKRTLRKCSRTEKKTENIHFWSLLKFQYIGRSLFKGRWKRHLKKERKKGGKHEKNDRSHVSCLQKRKDTTQK